MKNMKESMNNSRETYYKARAKEMFSNLVNFLYEKYEVEITKNSEIGDTSTTNDSVNDTANDLEVDLEVQDQENQHPEHAVALRNLVLVFEDLDDPDFLAWSVRKSKDLIKECRGVLIASFKGDTLLKTRIVSASEALSLIS